MSSSANTSTMRGRTENTSQLARLAGIFSGNQPNTIDVAASQKPSISTTSSVTASLNARRQRIRPISEWKHMHPDEVVKDALTTNRIVHAIQHLRLRMPIALDESDDTKSLQYAWDYWTLHSGRKIYQLLCNDEVDYLMLAEYLLRQYAQDPIAFLFHIFSHTTRPGLRQRLYRHLSHATVGAQTATIDRTGPMPTVTLSAVGHAPVLPPDTASLMTFASLLHALHPSASYAAAYAHHRHEHLARMFPSSRDDLLLLNRHPRALAELAPPPAVTAANDARAASALQDTLAEIVAETPVPAHMRPFTQRVAPVAVPVALLAHSSNAVSRGEAARSGFVLRAGASAATADASPGSKRAEDGEAVVFDASTLQANRGALAPASPLALSSATRAAGRSRVRPPRAPYCYTPAAHHTYPYALPETHTALAAVPGALVPRAAHPGASNTTGSVLIAAPHSPAHASAHASPLAPLLDVSRAVAVSLLASLTAQAAHAHASALMSGSHCALSASLADAHTRTLITDALADALPPSLAGARVRSMSLPSALTTRFPVIPTLPLSPAVHATPSSSPCPFAITVSLQPSPSHPPLLAVSRALLALAALLLPRGVYLHPLLLHTTQRALIATATHHYQAVVSQLRRVARALAVAVAGVTAAERHVAPASHDSAASRTRDVTALLQRLLAAPTMSSRATAEVPVASVQLASVTLGRPHTGRAPVVQHLHVWVDSALLFRDAPAVPLSRWYLSLKHHALMPVLTAPAVLPRLLATPAPRLFALARALGLAPVTLVDLAQLAADAAPVSPSPASEPALARDLSDAEDDAPVHVYSRPHAPAPDAAVATHTVTALADASARAQDSYLSLMLSMDHVLHPSFSPALASVIDDAFARTNASVHRTPHSFTHTRASDEANAPSALSASAPELIELRTGVRKRRSLRTRYAALLSRTYASHANTPASAAANTAAPSWQRELAQLALVRGALLPLDGTPTASTSIPREQSALQPLYTAPAPISSSSWAVPGISTLLSSAFSSLVPDTAVGAAARVAPFRADLLPPLRTVPVEPAAAELLARTTSSLAQWRTAYDTAAEQWYTQHRGVAASVAVDEGYGSVGPRDADADDDVFATDRDATAVSVPVHESHMSWAHSSYFQYHLDFEAAHQLAQQPALASAVVLTRVDDFLAHRYSQRAATQAQRMRQQLAARQGVLPVGAAELDSSASDDSEAEDAAVQAATNGLSHDRVDAMAHALLTERRRAAAAGQSLPTSAQAELRRRVRALVRGAGALSFALAPQHLVEGVGVGRSTLGTGLQSSLAAWTARLDWLACAGDVSDNALHDFHHQHHISAHGLRMYTHPAIYRLAQRDAHAAAELYAAVSTPALIAPHAPDTPAAVDAATQLSTFDDERDAHLLFSAAYHRPPSTKDPNALDPTVVLHRLLPSDAPSTDSTYTDSCAACVALEADADMARALAPLDRAAPTLAAPHAAIVAGPCAVSVDVASGAVITLPSAAATAQLRAETYVGGDTQISVQLPGPVPTTLAVASAQDPPSTRTPAPARFLSLSLAELAAWPLDVRLRVLLDAGHSLEDALAAYFVVPAQRLTHTHASAPLYTEIDVNTYHIAPHAPPDRPSYLLKYAYDRAHQPQHLPRPLPAPTVPTSLALLLSAYARASPHYTPLRGPHRPAALFAFLLLNPASDWVAAPYTHVFACRCRPVVVSAATQLDGWTVLDTAHPDDRGPPPIPASTAASVAPHQCTCVFSPLPAPYSIPLPSCVPALYYSLSFPARARLLAVAASLLYAVAHNDLTAISRVLEPLPLAAVHVAATGHLTVPDPAAHPELYCLYDMVHLALPHASALAKEHIARTLAAQGVFVPWELPQPGLDGASGGVGVYPYGGAHARAQLDEAHRDAGGVEPAKDDAGAGNDADTIVPAAPAKAVEQSPLLAGVDVDAALAPMDGRLDFLPLVRRLTRCGLLFRPQPVSARGQARARVRTARAATATPVAAHLRPLRVLDNAVTVSVRHDAPDEELSVWAGADLAQLLPFGRPSPLHAYVLLMLARAQDAPVADDAAPAEVAAALSAWGVGRGALQRYLTHYQLRDFSGFPTAARVLFYSSNASAHATTSTGPLSTLSPGTPFPLTGWPVLMLLLREGRWLQAALVNAVLAAHASPALAQSFAKVLAAAAPAESAPQLLAEALTYGHAQTLAHIAPHLLRALAAGGRRVAALGTALASQATHALRATLTPAPPGALDAPFAAEIDCLYPSLPHTPYLALRAPADALCARTRRSSRLPRTITAAPAGEVSVSADALLPFLHRMPRPGAHTQALSALTPYIGDAPALHSALQHDAQQRRQLRSALLRVEWVTGDLLSHKGDTSLTALLVSLGLDAPRLFSAHPRLPAAPSPPSPDARADLALRLARATGLPPAAAPLLAAHTHAPAAQRAVFRWSARHAPTGSALYVATDDTIAYVTPATASAPISDTSAASLTEPLPPLAASLAWLARFPPIPFISSFAPTSSVLPRLPVARLLAHSRPVRALAWTLASRSLFTIPRPIAPALVRGLAHALTSVSPALPATALASSLLILAEHAHARAPTLAPIGLAPLLHHLCAAALLHPASHALFRASLALLRALAVPLRPFLLFAATVRRVFLYLLLQQHYLHTLIPAQCSAHTRGSAALPVNAAPSHTHHYNRLLHHPLVHSHLSLPVLLAHLATPLIPRVLAITTVLAKSAPTSPFLRLPTAPVVALSDCAPVLGALTAASAWVAQNTHVLCALAAAPAALDALAAAYNDALGLSDTASTQSLPAVARAVRGASPSSHGPYVALTAADLSWAWASAATPLELVGHSSVVLTDAGELVAADTARCVPTACTAANPCEGCRPLMLAVAALARWSPFALPRALAAALACTRASPTPSALTLADSSRFEPLLRSTLLARVPCAWAHGSLVDTVRLFAQANDSASQPCVGLDAFYRPHVPRTHTSALDMHLTCPPWVLPAEDGCVPLPALVHRQPLFALHSLRILDTRARAEAKAVSRAARTIALDAEVTTLDALPDIDAAAPAHSEADSDVAAEASLSTLRIPATHWVAHLLRTGDPVVALSAADAHSHAVLAAAVCSRAGSSVETSSSTPTGAARPSAAKGGVSGAGGGSVDDVAAQGVLLGVDAAPDANGALAALFGYVYATLLRVYEGEGESDCQGEDADTAELMSRASTLPADPSLFELMAAADNNDRLTYLDSHALPHAHAPCSTAAVHPCLMCEAARVRFALWRSHRQHALRFLALYAQHDSAHTAALAAVASSGSTNHSFAAPSPASLHALGSLARTQLEFLTAHHPRVLADAAAVFLPHSPLYTLAAAMAAAPQPSVLADYALLATIQQTPDADVTAHVSVSAPEDAAPHLPRMRTHMSSPAHPGVPSLSLTTATATATTSPRAGFTAPSLSPTPSVVSSPSDHSAAPAQQPVSVCQRHLGLLDHLCVPPAPSHAPGVVPGPARLCLCVSRDAWQRATMHLTRFTSQAQALLEATERAIGAAGYDESGRLSKTQAKRCSHQTRVGQASGISTAATSRLLRPVTGTTAPGAPLDAAVAADVSCARCVSPAVHVSDTAITARPCVCGTPPVATALPALLSLTDVIDIALAALQRLISLAPLLSQFEQRMSPVLATVPDAQTLRTCASLLAPLRRSCEYTQRATNSSPPAASIQTCSVLPVRPHVCPSPSLHFATGLCRMVATAGVLSLRRAERRHLVYAPQETRLQLPSCSCPLHARGARVGKHTVAVVEEDSLSLLAAAMRRYTSTLWRDTTGAAHTATPRPTASDTRAATPAQCACLCLSCAALAPVLPSRAQRTASRTRWNTFALQFALALSHLFDTAHRAAAPVAVGCPPHAEADLSIPSAFAHAADCRVDPPSRSHSLRSFPVDGVLRACSPAMLLGVDIDLVALLRTLPAHTDAHSIVSRLVRVYDPRHHAITDVRAASVVVSSSILPHVQPSPTLHVLPVPGHAEVVLARPPLPSADGPLNAQMLHHALGLPPAPLAATPHTPGSSAADLGEDAPTAPAGGAGWGPSADSVVSSLLHADDDTAALVRAATKSDDMVARAEAGVVLMHRGVARAVGHVRAASQSHAWRSVSERMRVWAEAYDMMVAMLVPARERRKVLLEALESRHAHALDVLLLQVPLAEQHTSNYRHLVLVLGHVRAIAARIAADARRLAGAYATQVHVPLDTAALEALAAPFLAARDNPLVRMASGVEEAKNATEGPPSTTVPLLRSMRVTWEGEVVVSAARMTADEHCLLVSLVAQCNREMRRGEERGRERELVDTLTEVDRTLYAIVSDDALRDTLYMRVDVTDVTCGSEY